MCKCLCGQFRRKIQKVSVCKAPNEIDTTVEIVSENGNEFTQLRPWNVK